MTESSPGHITMSREFVAPPTAVFEAWTRAELFAQWFGGAHVQVPAESVDFVGEPGRTWSAQMVLPDGNTINWGGEFVAVEPNTRIVLTITDRPEEAARAAITVDLAATTDGTLMEFTQETPGFTPEQQAGLIAGWQGFMDELERIVLAKRT